MTNTLGTDFDDFLAEERLLEETTAAAQKRVTAWQRNALRVKPKANWRAWREIAGLRVRFPRRGR